jgi:serine/threonine protein kinase
MYRGVVVYRDIKLANIVCMPYVCMYVVVYRDIKLANIVCMSYVCMYVVVYRDIKPANILVSDTGRGQVMPIIHLIEPE